MDCHYLAPLEQTETDYIDEFFETRKQVVLFIEQIIKHENKEMTNLKIILGSYNRHRLCKLSSSIVSFSDELKLEVQLSCTNKT